MFRMNKVQIVSLFIVFFCISNILYADEWTHLANRSKLQQDGKYADAIEEYNKVIDNNPHIIEAYGNTGYIYQYELLNYQNASDAYLEGLKFAPDDFSLNMNLMYLYFKMDVTIQRNSKKITALISQIPAACH